MNKLVFFTDPHFCANNGNKLVFESSMEFFEKQFFPYLIDNKIEDCFCLGDLFDSRSNLDTYILQELHDRFFSWFDKNNINFHSLCGNHDQTLKDTNSHHALKVAFRGFDFCHYYDTTTKKHFGKYIIGLIPWINKISDFEIPTGCDVLLMHPEFTGYQMVKGIDCKKGLSLAEFQKHAKIVLAGHFHLQNLPYIGTPYQKDWNDFDSKKGFWTLDDNFDLTFHENEISPKFLKIYYSQVNGLRVEGL
jgi:UDP-2,3-diacylglucosamine pyrophosphatase LpxH